MSFKVSRIEKVGEDPKTLEKQGYSILSDVPIEFKPRFEMDMNAALMNIAGISISYVTRFLSYNNIQNCYNESPNPFTNNVLTIGMSDNLTIREFFKPELVDPDLAARPIFIHIDTSLTGDRTGIGATAVMGYRYENKYDIESGDYIPTKELMYREVFNLAIQCPTGTEISFQKTRAFIYYLKHNLMWNIKAISLDGFQSADTKQQLITMGFDDTSIVSLDRTENGYMAYKSAINEHRISMLNIPERETELVNLEQNNMTGKVDHPLNYTNGDIGRKDMSDASAGALYNASIHEKDLNLHLVDSADLIIKTNDSSIINDDRERVLSSIVSSPIVGTSDDNILDNATSISDVIKDEISNIRNNNENKNDDIIRKFREAKRKQMSSTRDIAELQDKIDSDDGFIIF